MDIEVIDTNDTPPIQKMKKRKMIGDEIPSMKCETVVSRHVRQSETARFITRYVPEFLKHFRGSLIKATRSKTFEVAPRKQIMIPGTLKYMNRMSKLAMCGQIASLVFSINWKIQVLQAR